MNDKKAISIEELKLKLKRLKALDRGLQVFGAWKHKYISYPVSRYTIEQLETKLHIRLPEDYRQFLQVIGYGAGPYYGLLSPERILVDLLDQSEIFVDLLGIGEKDFRKNVEEQMPDSSQPFPLNREQANECWEIMGEHREAAHLTAFPTDGYIPICEEGCGYVTCLVTAGELTGSLWSHNEYPYFKESGGPYMDVWNLAPEPPAISLRIPGYTSPSRMYGWEAALSPFPTFIEWYNAWIDRCLLDSGEQNQVRGSNKELEPNGGSKNIFRFFNTLKKVFSSKDKSG